MAASLASRTAERPTNVAGLYLLSSPHARLIVSSPSSVIWPGPTSQTPPPGMPIARVTSLWLGKRSVESARG